jgi:UDP-N-acetylglucosamine--N-acetylmuramyl-(pentapeptide) pyrophosphoryl-undecaprenol N-acetylglucosamine transferase
MVMFARDLRVLLAGGGTGGHLYPAVAAMERLRARRPDTRFLLHVTGRASESRLPLPDFVRCEVVDSPRPGPGLRRRATFPARLARAVAIAGASLRRFRPAVTVGLGGYGSVATVLAARALGAPVVLLEQNAVPGRANRALAPMVRAVSVAFEEAAEVFSRRARMTGNPVRDSILDRTPDPARFGLEPGRPTLGVVGGSLGARALNLVVEAGLPALAREGIQLLHLCGPEDREHLERAAAEAGVRARVLPFLEDMGAFYATADVVLGRAGGTTVAELAAAGRPSVLVPLGIHADGHQHRNATALARVGGSVVVEEVELNRHGLEGLVIPVLRDARRLERMAAAARGFGRPEAAEAVADLVLEVARGGGR